MLRTVAAACGPRGPGGRGFCPSTLRALKGGRERRTLLGCPRGASLLSPARAPVLRPEVPLLLGIRTASSLGLFGGALPQVPWGVEIISELGNIITQTPPPPRRPGGQRLPPKTAPGRGTGPSRSFRTLGAGGLLSSCGLTRASGRCPAAARGAQAAAGSRVPEGSCPSAVGPLSGDGGPRVRRPDRLPGGVEWRRRGAR